MDAVTHLELSERETPSCTYATVVFDARASDDWAELVDRTGCDCYCFRVASIPTALLTSRLDMWVRYSSRKRCKGPEAWQARKVYLVEVRPNTALPVLAEI